MSIRISQKLLTHKTLTECVCADTDESLKWASSGRYRDCSAAASLSLLGTFFSLLYCKTFVCVSSLDMTRRWEENDDTTNRHEQCFSITACNLTHNVESIYFILSIRSFVSKVSFMSTAGSQSVITVNIYSMLFWVQSLCTFTSVRFVLFKRSITSRLDQWRLISIKDQTSEN